MNRASDALRPRANGGQTTTLVAAMLFTLTIFVALVVNVGQLVNRRVALQLVADAGAWSGATVQAAQLNHYAYWSRLVQNTYVIASAGSLHFNLSGCYDGWTLAGNFYAANGGMVATVSRFHDKAFGEAEKHSKFNVDDLFPGEWNNFEFSTTAGPNEGGVAALANGNIVPTPLSDGDKLYGGDHEWRRETWLQFGNELAYMLAKYSPWRARSAGDGTESWTCGGCCPPYLSTVYMYGPPGYKLSKPGGPYLFVWRVREKQPTKALAFDTFFGPNAMPRMTAVAVAKAVGGDVHRGLSRYRAKMVPVSKYSATGGVINDPQARPGRSVPNPLRYIVH